LQKKVRLAKSCQYRLLIDKFSPGDFPFNQPPLRIEEKFYLNTLEAALVAHQSFAAQVSNFPAILGILHAQVIAQIYPGPDRLAALLAAGSDPITGICARLRRREKIRDLFD
jgi:hypothetical protein